MSSHTPGSPTSIHRCRLEPGDRILIHTGGVAEAWSTHGELFGEDASSAPSSVPSPRATPPRRPCAASPHPYDGPLTQHATTLLAAAPAP
ncbi:MULTISPECIES: hypothetical protein [unclassified Streptomyces]|uniref:hypothetical protein n=1 Tax=unclassified Streptomyces TaxID=2593676 RepID=UPI002E33D2D2|nr:MULTISPECIES: hypothetical protein [unclassified Streptomyces]WUC68300.1 SpoIIE family protein phosphatase [Streptomyces sp. NBC_00539]